MRRQALRWCLYWVSAAALTLTVVLSPVLAWLKTADVNDVYGHSKILGDLVSSIQPHAFWLLLAITITAALSKVLSLWVGRPWVWDAIDAILNSTRDVVFQIKDKEHPNDYYRVTLFKYMRFKFWIWPWRGLTPWGGSPFAGWLVPVARSGYMTLNTNTIFRVPRDGIDGGVEGVAGGTWRTGFIVERPDLPDVGDGSNGSLVEDYANKTWMTRRSVELRLSQKKRLPRAMYGLPVRMAGSAMPWGVIILDCQPPDGIRSVEQNAAGYSILLATLAELLPNAEKPVRLE